MQFGGLDLQFAGSSAAAVAAAAAANGTNAVSSSDAFEFNGSTGSGAAGVAATSVASVSAAPADSVKASDAYTTAPPSAKEVNKSLSGMTAGPNKLNSDFSASSKGSVPSASVNSYNSRYVIQLLKSSRSPI